MSKNQSLTNRYDFDTDGINLRDIQGYDRSRDEDAITKSIREEAEDYGIDLDNIRGLSRYL